MCHIAASAFDAPDETPALRAEIARLEAWVRDMQAGCYVNCVYCGHRYGPDPGTPRWMILCGSEEPIALAFAEFEGYLRLPTSALHADENFRATHEHVKYVNQVASTPDGVRAVISIPLIMATIRNRISQHRPTKET